MQDIKSRIMKAFVLVVCITVTLGFVLTGISLAKTAKEIDASVEASLERFQKEVKGCRGISQERKGCADIAGGYQGWIGHWR